MNNKIKEVIEELESEVDYGYKIKELVPEYRRAVAKAVESLKEVNKY